MVFGSLLKSKKKESIYLGSPEAEADANPNSRIPLSEVYEDFHQLLPQLMHEKFIVVGRKGSGKALSQSMSVLKPLTNQTYFVNL